MPENIEKKGEFFGLKVEGDSMIEAGINDGDTVIVKKTKKLTIIYQQEVEKHRYISFLWRDETVS